MHPVSSTIVLTTVKIETNKLTSHTSIIISILKITFSFLTDAEGKIHYFKNSIKSFSKSVLFKK